MTKPPCHSNPQLRAFVANCLMGGDAITETPKKWIRDLVIFECEGRSIQFRQKPEVINGNLDQFIGRCAETTEVIVANVSDADVVGVKLAIERICWLLSFVSGCRVICYEHEYPNGSGLMHFSAASGVAQHFRPVLNIRDGKQVKAFVEQTYDNYACLEQSRKLNVVIDYLAQAEAPGQLLEIRSVLVFVALESLKHTFAHSEGILYADGAFRKPTWTPGKRGHNYGFMELVKMMLGKVNMTCDLTSAYALRNDLIHSGLSSESFNRQRELYEDVHDLNREYMLRLLGYRGRYSPYAFERRGISAEIS